jgi:CRISPR type IV-associated protein Csf2
MNQAKKYIIAADLTLTAPMHITAVEKGTYDSSAQRLHRYDAPQGVQCALTRTVKLAFAATAGEDGVTRAPAVPVIPASTLAGKLRRAAADLLFESMVARDLQISPDAYNTLTSGTPTTELKAGDATPESMRAARSDPFLSLFGGTSFAMSAGSVIAEGWPLLDLTTGLLMTEAIVPNLPFSQLKDMTDAVAIVRKNDVADLRGAQLEGVVKFEALCDYLSGEADDREASKAKKKAGEGGKKTSLRALNAFEAVRAGLSFALRVEVTARTPAHLGLMLMAVQHFMRAGQVGGKGARGMGRFAVSASRLYELDPANRQILVLSEVFHDKATGYAFQHSDVITEAAGAAQDYIDHANPALYEAFAAANAKAIKALDKPKTAPAMEAA